MGRGDKQGLRGRASASFATTHWTTVLAAGKGDTPSARAALERLCTAYWYPLYAYVRRKGYPASDAEDLVQGFFERLLRLDSLTKVKQERGRFRTFLLAGLNHYLADEWDRASARKRDARRMVSLDGREAETRYQHEAADSETPERVFLRQWAIALLASVLEQLSGEYEKAGKKELFAALRFAISGESGKALAYAELAGTLKMGEPALRVAAHRLRRRYRAVLRDEIAQTVDSEQEVEEELRELLAAVG